MSLVADFFLSILRTKVDCLYWYMLQKGIEGNEKCERECCWCVCSLGGKVV